MVRNRNQQDSPHSGSEAPDFVYHIICPTICFLISSLPLRYLPFIRDTDMPACRIDVLSARVFVSLLVCFVATTLAVDTIFQQDEDTYWAIADGEQALSIHNTIRVPHTTPSHASPPIDRSFIGFAFEEASFPPYVQTRDGSINQFSLNLIDAIVSRTGGRPIVRLGGTSADFARYVPTQSETALPVAEVYNYQVTCSNQP